MTTADTHASTTLVAPASDANDAANSNNNAVDAAYAIRPAAEHKCAILMKFIFIDGWMDGWQIQSPNRPKDSGRYHEAALDGRSL